MENLDLSLLSDQELRKLVTVVLSEQRRRAGQVITRAMIQKNLIQTILGS